VGEVATALLLLPAPVLSTKALELPEVLMNSALPELSPNKDELELLERLKFGEIGKSKNNSGMMTNLLAQQMPWKYLLSKSIKIFLVKKYQIYFFILATKNGIFN
jgi:hypothetical protein